MWWVSGRGVGMHLWSCNAAHVQCFSAGVAISCALPPFTHPPSYSFLCDHRLIWRVVCWQTATQFRMIMWS